MLGKIYQRNPLSIDRMNESYFIELNLKRTKWLISYSHNPNRSNIYSHLECLDRNLDLYSSNSDNYLVVGKSNAPAEDSNIKNTCKRFSLKNSIKDTKCYKNPNNPKRQLLF